MIASLWDVADADLGDDFCGPRPDESQCSLLAAIQQEKVKRITASRQLPRATRFAGATTVCAIRHSTDAVGLSRSGYDRSI